MSYHVLKTNKVKIKIAKIHSQQCLFTLIAIVCPIYRMSLQVRAPSTISKLMNSPQCGHFSL